MIMKRLFYLLCLSTLLCTPVLAEEMRCGVKRIKEGDSEFDLKDACGRPDSRRTSMENIRDGSTGKIRSARVENYVYENHSRGSTYVVSVIEGRIVRIRTDWF